MSRFTTSDGLSLHFTDEGEGLPVLCLAGLTRAGTDFDYVAPHLSDVRLIRLDYRGRGQSDWAEDWRSYSIPREALDALELLDHLGLAQAAILGTSRGGVIAMGLAGTAKDRLLGVCLNDIGPKIEEAGLDVIRDYLGKTPAAKTRLELAALKAKLLTAFQNVPDSRWLEEAQRQTVEGPDGLTLRYDPKLRDAVLESSANLAPDLWPYFDALAGLPLALIRGANSDLLSKETAAEMARRRPDMIWAEVPGRGHIPFLDEPESLAAIRAWLEKMQ